MPSRMRPAGRASFRGRQGPGWDGWATSWRRNGRGRSGLLSPEDRALRLPGAGGGLLLALEGPEPLGEGAGVGAGERERVSGRDALVLDDPGEPVELVRRLEDRDAVCLREV